MNLKAVAVSLPSGLILIVVTVLVVKSNSAGLMDLFGHPENGYSAPFRPFLAEKRQLRAGFFE